MHYSESDNILYVLTQKDLKLRAYSIQPLEEKVENSNLQFGLSLRHALDVPSEGLSLLVVESPKKAIFIGLITGNIFYFPEQGDPYELEGHTKGTGVYSLIYAPQAGVVLSGGQDGVVKFWQQNAEGKYTPTHSFENMGYVTSMKLLEGDTLFTGSMNGLCAMNLPSLNMCGRINTGPVIDLCSVTGTDNLVLVICLDGAIKVVSKR
jgi:hypothetical protein